MQVQPSFDRGTHAKRSALSLFEIYHTRVRTQMSSRISVGECYAWIGAWEFATNNRLTTSSLRVAIPARPFPPRFCDR